MKEEDINYSHIELLECGKEKCSVLKNILFDPKESHFLHYVLKGKGTYIIGEETYELGMGDFFYIPPKTEVRYFPDKEDPWTYTWISISGDATDAFFRQCAIDYIHPTFHIIDARITAYFKSINDSFVRYGDFDLSSYGNLYLLLSFLYENKLNPNTLSTRERIVLEAKEYIKNNYQFNITMSDVSENIGVKNSYISKAFIDTLGYSPKKYLTELKMNQACFLLRDGKYTVKEVGQMVGYNDQLHFSNEFKKNIGISPIKFKNSQL